MCLPHSHTNTHAHTPAIALPHVFVIIFNKSLSDPPVSPSCLANSRLNKEAKNRSWDFMEGLLVPSTAQQAVLFVWSLQHHKHNRGQGQRLKLAEVLPNWHVVVWLVFNYAEWITHREVSSSDQNCCSYQAVNILLLAFYTENASRTSLKRTFKELQFFGTSAFAYSFLAPNVAGWSLM